MLERCVITMYKVCITNESDKHTEHEIRITVIHFYTIHFILHSYLISYVTYTFTSGACDGDHITYIYYTAEDQALRVLCSDVKAYNMTLPSECYKPLNSKSHKTCTWFLFLSGFFIYPSGLIHKPWGNYVTVKCQ